MSDADHLAQGHHVVEVEGLAQSYHVVGNGPVCVAHSGGPGIDWEYMRAPQLERHLTMVYLEPIGTGASGRLSEHPRGYTTERYSLQLNSFLDVINVDDVLLLGHSHGGFVVQEAALTSSTRIAGVVLYATSAVTGSEFMQAAGRAVEAYCARRADTFEGRSVAEAWKAIPEISDDADYTAAMRGLLPVYFVDANVGGVAYERLHKSLVATLVVGGSGPFDVRDRLAGLKTPTLILVGEHDFICGPRWARILQDHLPDESFKAFGSSGHFIHLEEPDEFADEIRRFSGMVQGREQSATNPV